jgi:hypothetical protein
MRDAVKIRLETRNLLRYPEFSRGYFGIPETGFPECLTPGHEISGVKNLGAYLFHPPKISSGSRLTMLVCDREGRRSVSGAKKRSIIQPDRYELPFRCFCEWPRIPRGEPSARSFRIERCGSSELGRLRTRASGRPTKLDAGTRYGFRVHRARELLHVGEGLSL